VHPLPRGVQVVADVHGGTDDPRGRSTAASSYALQLRQRYYDTRRRLLNIATAGACIVDDFPELSGHHAKGYAEGLARRPLKHGDMRHPAVQPAHMHDHRPPGTLKAATDGALLSFTGFSVTDGGAIAASLPDGGAVFVWEKGPDRYSPS